MKKCDCENPTEAGPIKLLFLSSKILLNFRTKKNITVVSEIDTRIEKCQVCCVRESPTSTTLSVYSIAEEVSGPVPIQTSGWILG